MRLPCCCIGVSPARPHLPVFDTVSGGIPHLGAGSPGLCRQCSFPLREHQLWGRGVPAKQDLQLRFLQHCSQRSTVPVPDGPGKGAWSGVVQMGLTLESVCCCPACCALEHALQPHVTDTLGWMIVCLGGGLGGCPSAVGCGGLFGFCLPDVWSICRLWHHHTSGDIPRMS